MTKLKSLLVGKLKDKASIGKAKLLHSFSSKPIKYIHIALLKSTTHTSHKPPNTNYVSAVISYSNSPHSSVAFEAALWRLRVTKDAFVAAKSLFVYHKLLKSLGDNRLDGGRNDDLKLNDFTDKSSNLTLELSQWVRWYGHYLDHLSWISKLLGSYPSLRECSKEKAKEQDCVSSYETEYVMRQTDSLVTLFKHMCTRPETPPLYCNKTVDEIRELVIQDYFTVIRLVMVRLQVVSERLTKPEFDDPVQRDLRLALVRLEECKMSLSGFFWRCKRLAEDFWCMVEKLKAETVKANAVDQLPGSVQKEWVTF